MRALNAVEVLVDAGMPREVIVASSYGNRRGLFESLPMDDAQNRVAYVSFQPSQGRSPGALLPFER
jgi:hypothetical protein